MNGIREADRLPTDGEPTANRQQTVNQPTTNRQPTGNQPTTNRQPTDQILYFLKINRSFQSKKKYI